MPTHIRNNIFSKAYIDKCQEQLESGKKEDSIENCIK